MKTKTKSGKGQTRLAHPEAKQFRKYFKQQLFGVRAYPSWDTPHDQPVADDGKVGWTEETTPGKDGKPVTLHKPVGNICRYTPTKIPLKFFIQMQAQIAKDVSDKPDSTILTYG